MFNLKRPCTTCPFRKGAGKSFRLSAERLEQIRTAPAFQCHKTVDYDAGEERFFAFTNIHDWYQLTE